MAIDPSIALRYRSPQVQSPLDSFTKTVQVAEMLSQMQDRQSRAAEYATQEPLRKAETLAKQQELAEAAAMKRAASESFKPYDPEVGDLEYDDAKWNDILDTTDIPGIGKASYLKPRFQAEKAAQLAAHRELALNELTRANTMLAKEAVPIRNFLALPEEKRKAAYSGLKAALTPISPLWGKVLGPEYDPASETKLRPVLERYDLQVSSADRLAAAKTAAETRKIEAEAEKAEKEAASPDYHNAPPGTLIIKTDATGKEIERIQVPFKEEAKSDKQIAAELVEEAYGQIILKGIPRDKMTAAQKVAARRWDEANSQDPAKKTDHDKRVELAVKNPKLYKFVYPGGEQTDADLVAARNAIIDKALARATETGRFNAKTYENERAIWKQSGVELPALINAQGTTVSPTTPPVPTKTPTTGMFTVTAPNGKAYTFDTQAQVDEFKKRAGIK